MRWFELERPESRALHTSPFTAATSPPATSSLHVAAMKHRSAEAMARRAEKRGTTVEEQKKIDRGEKPGKAPKRHRGDEEAAASGSAPKAHRRSAEAMERRAAGGKRARADDGSKKDVRKGGWACEKCGFSNFAMREQCRECGAPRPKWVEVEMRKEAEEKQRRKERRLLKPNEKRRAVAPSTAAPAAAVAAPAAAAPAPAAAEPTPKPAWSIPAATADDIHANMRLRERLRAEDPTLTAEERTRAEMLLARDERKKAKKAERGAGGGRGGGKGFGKGKGSGKGFGGKGGRGSGFGRGRGSVI